MCLRACVRVCVCVNPITGVLRGILDTSFKVALTNAHLKCVNLMCEHFHYRHIICMFSMIYLEFSLTKRSKEQSPYSISYVVPFGYVVTFLKLHSPTFGIDRVEITPGTILRFFIE